MKTKSPIFTVTSWIRRQPPKMKVFLAVLSGIAALLFLRMVVEDHNNLFVAAEFVHVVGTCVLIYKLTKVKTCAGISLKSQELTAMFLAVRLYCSFVMEYDIHTLLDTATLICWAFCVYLEAISVLPQLRLMQNIKIIEPFTSHYVFALGVARFLSSAHWVIQLFDTRGRLLTALGYGLWPCLVMLSEIVQTFILADFCYYYVKSILGGQLAVRLPAGVV
ncbi:hypothetical protein V6N12_051172 [Hibiscus sabdariffa]|uniref:ER lumen protein retaining receptor n=1 Tax=Hibiscus sabdariffa TaxID=183260 RepID=A0ABR2GF62_9ROSI